MTATEYLEAVAAAMVNGADKPPLQHIEQELEKLPGVRERLVLELLPIVWQTLDAVQGPEMFAVFFITRSAAITPDHLAEYKLWTERIAQRTFELLGGRTSCRDKVPLDAVLRLIVTPLRKCDPDGFTSLLETLYGQCRDAGDTRRELLDEIKSALKDGGKGG
jgi:hypothetical protein